MWLTGIDPLTGRAHDRATPRETGVCGEVMGKILCLVGLHSWQHGHNPEVGGPGGDYEVCSRCGKEKKVYGKPPPTGVGGGGA